MFQTREYHLLEWTGELVMKLWSVSLIIFVWLMSEELNANAIADPILTSMFNRNQLNPITIRYIDFQIRIRFRKLLFHLSNNLLFNWKSVFFCHKFRNDIQIDCSNNNFNSNFFLFWYRIWNSDFKLKIAFCSSIKPIDSNMDFLLRNIQQIFRQYFTHFML